MKVIALVLVAIAIVFGVVLLRPDVETKVSIDDINKKRTERAAESSQGVLDTIGPMVEVYDGIRVSANSRTLDVSGKGLTGSLKAEVRELSKLQELDMSDNELTGIPAEVGQLSQLEVLDLSNNPFTGLPYELGNLANLKVLDLRGTNYAEADLNVIKQTLPASVEIITFDPKPEVKEVFEIQGRE